MIFEKIMDCTNKTVTNCILEHGLFSHVSCFWHSWKQGSILGGPSDKRRANVDLIDNISENTGNPLQHT